MNDLIRYDHKPKQRLLPDYTGLHLEDFSILIVKRPLFCPRTTCPNHHEPKGDWYSHFGRYHTRAHGWVKRFICTHCRKTCSSQTFHISYYAKRRYPYPALMLSLCSTSSLRAIGRSFSNRSVGSVSNHLARIARQAMVMKAHLMKEFTLKEDLCADGFVNFSTAQYFPTQSHILVGSKSLMLYFADIITQRRSGRMREDQRIKRNYFDTLFPFDPHGVIKASWRFIHQALTLFATSYRPEKILYTDMKREYRTVFNRIVDPRLGITHYAISSKRARTRKNPLFPVNYFDREFRKDLHDCVRETVCFSRNLNRHMQRLAVYQLWHNYLKPYRVGTRDRRPHAVVAGMNKWEAQKALVKCLSLRQLLSKNPVEPFERRVWTEKLLTPLIPETKTRALAKHFLA